MNAGDELAVFDGTVCVGAVTVLPGDIESGVLSVAVSAADNYGMPGFIEGDSYEFRFWQSKSQIEQVLHPVVLRGPSLFVKNESAVLSLKNFSDIEQELIKNNGVKCYPNPFNKELIVEVSLTEAAELDVRIINQLGQKVKHLVNKQHVNAGLHQWSWNGDNGSGQKVDPGIYYIRFSTNDKTVVNKVVLTK